MRTKWRRWRGRAGLKRCDIMTHRTHYKSLYLLFIKLINWLFSLFSTCDDWVWNNIIVYRVLLPQNLSYRETIPQKQIDRIMRYFLEERKSRIFCKSRMNRCYGKLYRRNRCGFRTTFVDPINDGWSGTDLEKILHGGVDHHKRSLYQVNDTVAHRDVSLHYLCQYHSGWVIRIPAH